MSLSRSFIASWNLAHTSVRFAPICSAKRDSLLHNTHQRCDVRDTIEIAWSYERDLHFLHGWEQLNPRGNVVQRVVVLLDELLGVFEVMFSHLCTISSTSACSLLSSSTFFASTSSSSAVLLLPGLGVAVWSPQYCKMNSCFSSCLTLHRSV